MLGLGSLVGVWLLGNVSIDELLVCDKFVNNGLGSYVGIWCGCGV